MQRQQIISYLGISQNNMLRTAIFISIHILPQKNILNFIQTKLMCLISIQIRLAFIRIKYRFIIRLPLQQPSLEDAMIYRPQEQKKSDDDGQVQTITQEDQLAPPEHTDEELLDPIIMETIEEKLVARSQDMEQKLQNLVGKKK